MWVLDVLSPASGAVETTFYLVAGAWSIGRKKCHFNFHADASISRSHALLRVGTLTAEQLRDPATRPPLALEDLGSRFGSFVNQEQVLHAHPLKHGDQLSFGAKRTLLRVRYQVFILVASRVQRANRARVSDACQQIGMHLVANERKDATHCIMDPGRVVATVKVLWALVYNQPVVCTPWLFAILGRKSMAEPLPRCEEFLPHDPFVPSVASSYLPNPMRKTLYHRHALVFLTPQAMEEIVAEMAGAVVAAYRDSERDDLLLRDIEQHAASRHVLVVEPVQGSGFSSVAASSDGRELQNTAGGGTCAQTAVDRRLCLFRSMGASFVTVQELAASVIFVKAPSPSSDYSSFSSSLAGHHSSSVQILSFPEHLSLPAPPPSADLDEDESSELEPAHQSQLVVDERKVPTTELVLERNAPALVDSRIVLSRVGSNDSDGDSTAPGLTVTDLVRVEETQDTPVQVKEERQPFATTSVSRVKEEALEDSIVPASCSYLSEDLPADPSQVFSTNVLNLDPLSKSARPHSSEDSASDGSGWIATLSSMPRRLDDDLKDNVAEPKPVVKSCSLVLKRPAASGVNDGPCSSASVNFKRFRKGNGYAGRPSASSLFPTPMVVSVTVDNADRVAQEERLEALEEQERIADELFAMAENRKSRSRF